MLCLYYQAHVVTDKTWFFVGVLRSCEHLCFDRTVNKQESIFEFFVPEDNRQLFLELMQYMEQAGIISRLIQLPNRLTDPASIF